MYRLQEFRHAAQTFPHLSHRPRNALALPFLGHGGGDRGSNPTIDRTLSRVVLPSGSTSRS